MSTPRFNQLSQLRRLWPFIQRHRALFFAWLCALSLSSAATLSLPIAVKQMIDRGFTGGGQINIAFTWLFAVAVVLALTTALRFYLVSLLGEKVIADLRQKLYAHLIRLDAQFHHKTHSGELVSRLSADSELLRSVIGSTMSIALRNVVTVIGSISMLFFTSPRLGVLTLIGIPLAVLPIVLGARRIKKTARTTQDKVATANTLASETLGAVSTVQAHAREPYEEQRFAQALNIALNTAKQRIRNQAWVTAAAIILIFGAIVTVLWLGAHNVINGQMSPGTLGQFVLYALIGGSSVGALAEVWNELQRASGGMSRINELLQEPQLITAPTPCAHLALPVQGDIIFENISFNYPDRPDAPALDQLTLHIKPGETVAVVGPSGAGKSTLFALLLRFYDPTLGQIKLDGIPLTQLDPKNLREQIGLVPQHPTLFATTVSNNIRYGRLDADNEAVYAAAVAAEAADFILNLPQGYDSELGERGARLSGGQQQRITIARALLKNAPILLLDEATSALDAQSEHIVQQALTRLMTGRTTLVIAHRLATVLKADRIIVMDKGKVVDQGTHTELMARPGLYAQLAQLQFLG